MRNKADILAAVFTAALLLASSSHAEVPVGGRLGDHRLTYRYGGFNLGELKGRPVVMSFVYTTCTHTCGTLTASLKRAFDAEGSALGAGFIALTVGFDSERDTPEAMSAFGSAFTGDQRAWRFAAADRATLGKLMREAGFSFKRSGGGFAHPDMAVVIGPDGRVYKRLYGADLDPSELLGAVARSMDPEDPGYGERASSITEFLKGICYTYDERTGQYHIDYGFLSVVALGFTVQAGMVWMALYIRRSSRRRGGG